MSHLPAKGYLRPVLNRIWTVALSTAFFLGPVYATRLMADEGAASTDNVFYENTVEPIIVAKCVRCHNPDKSKGGLDLSTPQGILKGSDSGPL